MNKALHCTLIPSLPLRSAFSEWHSIRVLGQDSACRVVEYKEKGDTAIIRLRSPSQQDLETVAEALYQRVWEYQEKAQNAAMVRYAAYCLIMNSATRCLIYENVLIA